MIISGDETYCWTYVKDTSASVGDFYVGQVLEYCLTDQHVEPIVSYESFEKVEYGWLVVGG